MAKVELKYEIARRVVVPTMKVGNEPIFVKIVQAIEKRLKMEDEKQADGTVKPVEKTIEIARVVNLETGELVEIVVGTVLLSELDGGYPDASYVDKCFRIKKSDVAGKRYKTYELDEITVSAPGEKEDAAAGKGKGK
jgi:hypothetical protein